MTLQNLLGGFVLGVGIAFALHLPAPITLLKVPIRLPIMGFYEMGTTKQLEWMNSPNDLQIVKSPDSLPGECVFHDSCGIKVVWCESGMNGRFVCIPMTTYFADGTIEKYL